MVKFEILAAQGIQLNVEEDKNAIKKPEVVCAGYGSRRIAQVGMDCEMVLRVVYEQKEERIVVITFYPGKRSRYE